MTILPGTAPRCFALVPCAGGGRRAGGDVPKQYRPLAGRTVVGHTLAALAGVPRIEATLVVLAPDDRHFREQLPGFEGRRGWLAFDGGITRADSVRAGLRALRERGVAAHDWVLVHDAARCGLRPEWVERLIDACADDEVGGLLALPLPDTLKRADADGRIEATVPRERMWAAQTPQMFRLALLERALDHAASAGLSVTDEASAVEALGHAPRLVPGDIENLKLTWPGDFVLAERLLATRAPPAAVAATPSPADRADVFDLARFVSAQVSDYATALAELQAGRKQSHWIWYVLPQLRGLGSSARATRYGLGGLDEARAYLAHPLLGPRLRECVDATLVQPRADAEAVLGAVDALKYRSCLTLFAEAAPDEARFRAALKRFYGGGRCARTLALLDLAARRPGR